MKKTTFISFLFLLSFLFVFSTRCYAEASQYIPLKYEYHHIYPQQLRAEFEKIGINIDNYTIKILKKYHQNHKAINKSWEEFFAEHKNPTEAEAKKFAVAMLRKYNFKSKYDVGRIAFYNYITRKETGEFIDLTPNFFIRVLNFFGGIKGLVFYFLNVIGTFLLSIIGKVIVVLKSAMSAARDAFVWLRAYVGDALGWVKAYIGDILEFVFDWIISPIILFLGTTYGQIIGAIVASAIVLCGILLFHYHVI